MPTYNLYPQYSGSWSLSSVANARALGTWPVTSNLWSWGANGSGQLGLNNRTNYSSPIQTGATVSWLAVSAGYAFALGIKPDGTLWSWGANGNGQLGQGTGAGTFSSPKQVGSLTNWASITTAGLSSFAIKTDGTLWAWGYNNYGQLGDGTIASKSSPVQIGALTNWLNISCSYANVLAVKTDGTLWTWGQGSQGALGLNNQTNYSSPKQVGALTTWLRGSAGGYSCVAIKTDGTLWSWGYNALGQLGLGNRTAYSSPKQVGALTNWASTTSDKNQSYFYGAIKTDGTLWTWGANNVGQLGQGNLTYYSSPKQVGALTNWSKISGGLYNFMATKTDGTLWSWGYNTNGQLGLGNTIHYSSPKQVGSLPMWKTPVMGGNFGVSISY